MTETTHIELPTMLSYKRSISQGRALMFACSDMNGEGAEPLTVETVSLRATKAFDVWKNIEKSKKDNAALDKGIAEVTTPNPQVVEASFMPEDKPVLKTRFSLKYLPNAFLPYMANNLAVESIFRNVVSGYAAKGGFNVLAARYVEPLVTGLWMWRNNDEAINKRICVHVVSGAHKQTFEFTPPYNVFTLDGLAPDQQARAGELAQLIAASLSGEGRLVGLDVESFYELGAGTQAYPSQEMVMDKKEGEASRTLYKVSHGGIQNQAAIHEQKIGNALRTIDNWHGQEVFGTLAVEPLGVSSTRQASARLADKRDFYTLCKTKLATWEQEMASEKALSDFTDVDDLHYVIAVLVRGGAFV